MVAAGSNFMDTVPTSNKSTMMGRQREEMVTPKRERRVLQKPTENNYEISKKDDIPNRVRSHTLVNGNTKPPLNLAQSFKGQGRAPEFTESQRRNPAQISPLPNTRYYICYMNAVL